MCDTIHVIISVLLCLCDCNGISNGTCIYVLICLRKYMLIYTAVYTFTSDYIYNVMVTKCNYA